MEDKYLEAGLRENTIASCTEHTHTESVAHSRRKRFTRTRPCYYFGGGPSIQALLSVATCQDCSSDPIAPAWDGRMSAGGSSDVAFQAVRDRSSDERMAPHTPKNTGTLGNIECTDEPRRPQPNSPAPKELSDISADAQELERARRSDLQADQSHVRELRALVAEFVLKGRGGSREGYMAELLVEVGVRRFWRPCRLDVGTAVVLD